MIDCYRYDCLYHKHKDSYFKDKCEDCTENLKANQEIALFHYEDELYDED